MQTILNTACAAPHGHKENVVEIQKSNDPTEFVNFEREGWTAHMEGYINTLAAVTRQTVQATLQAAGVKPGDRVLDICCGPGMLSAAAVSIGASSVGLDFPDVVAMARKLVPDAEFQEGDATQIPFPDNSFDAVVCGYGILHVPDPERAMQEMLRVLRPGGRAALSVWDNETVPNGLGLVYKAAQLHADLSMALPHGPSVFQFSTLDTMRNALSRIGFTEVEAVHFKQGWQVKSGNAFLEALKVGTVRTGAILAAQTSDVLSKIAADFETALADLRTGDGLFSVPMPAIIGSGAKP